MAAGKGEQISEQTRHALGLTAITLSAFSARSRAAMICLHDLTAFGRCTTPSTNDIGICPGSAPSNSARTPLGEGLRHAGSRWSRHLWNGAALNERAFVAAETRPPARTGRRRGLRGCPGVPQTVVIGSPRSLRQTVSGSARASDCPPPTDLGRPRAPGRPSPDRLRLGKGIRSPHPGPNSVAAGLAIAPPLTDFGRRRASDRPAPYRCAAGAAPSLPGPQAWGRVPAPACRCRTTTWPVGGGAARRRPDLPRVSADRPPPGRTRCMRCRAR
jgi:hypothetical protein